jgi:hypothetical protein
MNKGSTKHAATTLSDDRPNVWYVPRAEDTAACLESVPGAVLTRDEVARRLAAHGPNWNANRWAQRLANVPVRFT